MKATARAPILGVILESDRANDDRFLKTDFIGNPLTVYPSAHFNNRGLEWDTDAAIINVGLTSVTVRLTEVEADGVVDGRRGSHRVSVPNNGLMSSLRAA